MKRKTYLRLSKKQDCTTAIIKRKWSDPYLYGGESDTVNWSGCRNVDTKRLEWSINVLKELRQILLAHQRRYKVLYPDESNYNVDIEEKTLEDILDTLDYYSDRWNAWHRIKFLIEAPVLYDKIMKENKNERPT